MKKVALGLSILICCSLHGGWFDKKPTAKDVSDAILAGRGDDLTFLRNQNNINPSSVKVEKSSVDGVWRVSYEAKDSITGKKTKYVSDVTTYKRKKGAGLGLHFVNTETTKEKIEIAPIVYEPKVEPVEKTFGHGDIEHLEQNGLASFCGFTFGNDYRKDKNESYVSDVPLSKPFRYYTKASLQHSRLDNGKYVLTRINLWGVLPSSFTKEQIAEEHKAVAAILEKKYAVKFETNYSWYSFGRQNKENKRRNFWLCAGWDSGSEYNCRIIVENNYPLSENEKSKLSADEGSDVL